MKARISFDSVAVIISLLNQLLYRNLKRLPCAGTVENPIGDSDVKLPKAIHDPEYVHIRDAGHTAAMQVEHVYKKDEEFKKFTKKLSAVKVREAMRETSYFLPPRRRSIARFMNLSAVTVRAANMLRIFPTLNGEEQKNV